MTEYEQMVLELYQTNKFYESLDDANYLLERIASENKKIETKKHKIINNNIDNLDWGFTFEFENKSYKIFSEDEIKTIILENGKKFGPNVDIKSKPTERKSDAVFSNLKITLLIPTILFFICGCGVAIANNFLRFWDVWYIHVWFIPGLVFAIAGALVTLLIHLIIYLPLEAKSNASVSKYQKSIIAHDEHEIYKKRNFEKFYHDEYLHLINEFNNFKESQKDKAVTLSINDSKELAVQQEILKEEKDNIKRKINEIENSSKTFMESSIIPITYLSDSEAVKKLMILLFNKRANNVTDLINLYETEKWRDKMLDTISDKFDKLYQVNEKTCERLSKIDENTSILNEQIASLDSSIAGVSKKLSNLETIAKDTKATIENSNSTTIVNVTVEK